MVTRFAAGFRSTHLLLEVQPLAELVETSSIEGSYPTAIAGQLFDPWRALGSTTLSHFLVEPECGQDGVQLAPRNANLWNVAVS
jgi:hypothetical protein